MHCEQQEIKQKALYLRLKMEQQLFLHGAATYPKFLLCPEERTGIDTNEIDDFSEKKNLCLQKKKKPTCPTTYTSYSACLRVLKIGQKHLKTVWWVSEGRDIKVVEKYCGENGFRYLQEGEMYQRSRPICLGTPWVHPSALEKRWRQNGRQEWCVEGYQNLKMMSWATDLTIMAS